MNSDKGYLEIKTFAQIYYLIHKKQLAVHYMSKKKMNQCLPQRVSSPKKRRKRQARVFTLSIHLIQLTQTTSNTVHNTTLFVIRGLCTALSLICIKSQ